MLWRSSGLKRQPPGFIEPCIPTRASKPPAGPQWIHEIKHDGYRLMARKQILGDERSVAEKVFAIADVFGSAARNNATVSTLVMIIGWNAAAS